MSTHVFGNPLVFGVKEEKKSIFENSKWLSSKDAAVYLGLSSVESFRNLVCRYGIPKHYLFGRLRFNIEELDKLILPFQKRR